MQPALIIAGLLIGAVGGIIFATVGFPAPWLAGSMVAGVVAVYCGARLVVPAWLRATAFILLGIQTGASVTWDTIERAAQWPFSIALLAVTVVAVTASGMRYFLKARGWTPATAFYASLPGALSLTLALADSAKADMRLVTISQCIRLFFLVAALPAAISLVSPEHAALPQPEHDSLGKIVLLLVVGSAAGLLVERLKVPAGLILGSIAASAALYLGGLVKGAAPDAILVPTNVILGIIIAARFENFSLAQLKNAFGAGFTGFLIALAISVLGAAIAGFAGGLPLPLTLLAFAPGGLEAMVIMSFALNLDPAYVAAHQIARYVGIVLLAPPLTAWIFARAAAHTVVSSRPGAARLEDD
jgi:hypothetical protein